MSLGNNIMKIQFSSKDSLVPIHQTSLGQLLDAKISAIKTQVTVCYKLKLSCKISFIGDILTKLVEAKVLTVL